MRIVKSGTVVQLFDEKGLSTQFYTDFESALGYDQSNAIQLMEQIQKNIANKFATSEKAVQYGQRYTVVMLIKGPNGKTATVRTG